jgi:hypothetical protein
VAYYRGEIVIKSGIGAVDNEVGTERGAKLPGFVLMTPEPFGDLSEPSVQLIRSAAIGSWKCANDATLTSGANEFDSRNQTHRRRYERQPHPLTAQTKRLFDQNALAHAILRYI